MVDYNKPPRPDAGKGPQPRAYKGDKFRAGYDKAFGAKWPPAPPALLRRKCRHCGCVFDGLVLQSLCGLKCFDEYYKINIEE